MIEDQLASGVDQLQSFVLQPAVEQGEIAAIGIASVIGQAFLQPQGVEKLVYTWVVNGGHRGSGHWKTDGKSFIACCGFIEPDAIDWVMA
ncbi:hypothetical protein D3C87_1997770 [compost metagenome]